MAREGGRRTRGEPVTVIITAWNRAASLGRAIDSALGQSHPTVDVVVVDDGSTDATPDVLARYATERRVRIVRHDRNRGVTAAKNTGLASLDERTAYFCFLDSDDTLLPDAVRALVAGFKAPDGPYSQVLGWCRDAGSGLVTGEIGHGEGTVTYEDALCGRFSGDFEHLVRRELLGSLRFEERASGGEASLWWRLLRIAPARLVPDVVATIERGGADRVSVARYEPEAATRRMWAYQAVVEAVGADMRRLCPRRFGTLNTDLAKWAAVAGDRPRARRAARRALRHAPGPRSLLMSCLWLVPPGLLRRVALARSRGAVALGGAA